MKTVFMIVNYPVFNMCIGISKKIEMQIKTFQKLGYAVYYSAYLENGIAIYCDGNLIAKKTYKSKRIHSFLRRFRLLSYCFKYLKNKKFNLGFVRWDPVDGLFLKNLKRLDLACDKVIMDFHGYFPNYSGKGLKGLYTTITTRLNGHRMSRYIDLGLVELKDESVFGIKTLPIDTSIEVDDYPVHNYVGEPNIINMISVANETPYHGYDRLIKGLYYYNLNKNNNSISIHFHLVGSISKRTKRLISRLNLSNCIHLYGYKKGRALYDIYNKCNIGVGPLAPHRIGGKQGTGIKTKEYFAIGIPYFYAGNELLVPEDYKFAHKIEDSERPVDLLDIIEFLKSINKETNVSCLMRDFARIHYSCVNTVKKALLQIGIEEI